MDEIGVAECRSIFLDWALSLPPERDQYAALQDLLAFYLPLYPDHPMNKVLQEGAGHAIAPRRRGGWRSRRDN